MFGKNQIQIVDEIINELDKEVTLELASNFSLRLVASGKFFAKTDLMSTRGQYTIAAHGTEKRETILQ